MAPHPVDWPRLHPAEAFAAFAFERELLNAGDVHVAEVWIPRAAEIAVEAGPRVRELLPEIRKKTPIFPVGSVVMLEAYAHGAWFAHLAGPIGDVEVTKSLLSEAIALRAALLAAAVACKPLRRRVRALRSGSYYLRLGADLVALARLFEETRVGGRATRVEPYELRRAREVASELNAAIAARHGSVDRSCRVNRAFTLLERAYSNCQSVVMFLRWKVGDADEITPSLLDDGSRLPRSSKFDEEEDDFDDDDDEDLEA